MATDASEQQIAAAGAQDGVTFRVAPAENSKLENHSVDLITVAQALLWFNIPIFFAEAMRVLKPGGILAAWSYEHCSVDVDVDAVFGDIFAEVEAFWPTERAIVANRYRDIKMPAPTLTVPEFDMTVEWSVEQILGYMRTWSATRRFMQAHATDPISIHEIRLRAAWDDSVRTVRWPLTLKACRVASS